MDNQAEYLLNINTSILNCSAMKSQQHSQGISLAAPFTESWLQARRPLFVSVNAANHTEKLNAYQI
jgi:hypothetical protein